MADHLVDLFAGTSHDRIVNLRIEQRVEGKNTEPIHPQPLVGKVTDKSVSPLIR